jgi:tetratricopeptide (TPR) repeat protein
MRSPENLSNEELSTLLRKLISNYLRAFPASPLREKLFVLWLDVCRESQDWKCLDSVSRYILNDKNLASINERAVGDRLEALKRGGEATWANRLAFLAEIHENRQSSKFWREASLLHAEGLSEKKDSKQAIQVLEKVLRADPDWETYYRLKWNFFQLGEHKKVLEPRKASEPRLKGKPDPRIDELARESSLALALEARKAGELEDYQKYLGFYFPRQSDEKKADIARTDLLRFLHEKEKFRDCAKLLIEGPVNWRNSKEPKDMAQELVSLLLSQAELDLAGKLLAAYAGAPTPTLLTLRVVHTLFEGGPQAVSPASLSVGSLASLFEAKQSRALALKPQVRFWKRSRSSATRELS